MEIILAALLGICYTVIVFFTGAVIGFNAGRDDK